MSNKKNEKRRSTCIKCDKRLSYESASGEIKWHASHVVDEGLFCEECFRKERSGKPARKPSA